MRVIHVINNLATGGAEKLLLETLPLFNNQQVTADLLLINGKETPFLHTLKKDPRIKFYALTNGSLYNPLLIFKLIPILKQYPIAHVHLFPALYYVAFAKWIGQLNIQLIFTEHSTSNKRIRIPFLKYLDRWIYQKYHTIITISEKVELSIQRHLKFNYNPFLRIENGVNLAKIKDALPSDMAFIENRNQKKVIIQVSSFQYPKDQKTVIKALKHLPENVVLVLVGIGVLKNEVEQFAKQQNLANRVYFLGQSMEVPQLLKGADVVVLSSHYEGLSLSSIEGMASGKPFVACNVTGLKEVVDGAGILFDKEDHLALATIFSGLLENSEYYESTVKNCLERSKLYDINNMIKKTIAHYQKCLQVN